MRKIANSSQVFHWENGIMLNLYSYQQFILKGKKSKSREKNGDVICFWNVRLWGKRCTFPRVKSRYEKKLSLLRKGKRLGIVCVRVSFCLFSSFSNASERDFRIYEWRPKRGQLLKRMKGSPCGPRAGGCRFLPQATALSNFCPSARVTTGRSVFSALWKFRNAAFLRASVPYACQELQRSTFFLWLQRRGAALRREGGKWTLDFLFFGVGVLLKGALTRNHEGRRAPAQDTSMLIDAAKEPRCIPVWNFSPPETTEFTGGLTSVTFS